MSEAVCSESDKLLPFRTRLGIFIVFEAALISTVSASILLSYTVYRVVQKVLARYTIRRTDPLSGGLLPIDATDSLGFIVLMFWELTKALGGMLDLRWALQGCVIEGSFCTAQGYLRQIGDTGVAFFSLFIGFDTFFVLVFRWRAPNRVNIGAIIGLNLFIFLLVAIGGGMNHRKYPSYIGDTIYWCWIQREYLADQVALEYLWMWVTSLVQIVLYAIIALVVRGSLVVEGRLLHPRTRGNVSISTLSQDSDIDDDDGERENRIIANLILFYPAIYIICVLPLSIVRWKYFARGEQTPASVLTASGIFQLSGFFNVLFYKFTRPDLVSAQNLEGASLTNNTASSRREEAPIRGSTLQGRLPDDDIPMSSDSPPVRMGSISTR